MNKDFQVAIPNVAFAWGSKYHLTTDEFMAYVYLQFMKPGGLYNTTCTTVDMLIKDLGLKTQNANRDRNNVVKTLQGLQSKGYIHIECESEIKKGILVIKHSFQEILMAKVEIIVDERIKKFEGYHMMKGKRYNLANNDGRKLMVIAYTDWRNNIPDYKYKISVDEWEHVLGITDKTVRNLLHECTELFLVKESGDHYVNENGQIKQEPNSYKVMPNKSEMSRTNIQQKKKESFLDKALEKCKDESIKNDKITFLEIFDKTTYLNQDGYYALMQTTCKYTKEQGEGKIRRVRESGEGGFKAMEALDVWYKEHIQQRETRERIFNAKAEEMAEAMAIDFDTPRKKRDKVEDDKSWLEFEEENVVHLFHNQEDEEEYELLKILGGK